MELKYTITERGHRAQIAIRARRAGKHLHHRGRCPRVAERLGKVPAPKPCQCTAIEKRRKQFGNWKMERTLSVAYKECSHDAQNMNVRNHNTNAEQHPFRTFLAIDLRRTNRMANHNHNCSGSSQYSTLSPARRSSEPSAFRGRRTTSNQQNLNRRKHVFKRLYLEPVTLASNAAGID